MTIQEKAREIEEEFELFDDWMEKYNYIIELGKNLDLIEPEFKTRQYIISGCQSQVWLRAELVDGLIWFKADSDAVITKGIVHLLIHVLEGQSPRAILDYQMDFIQNIGLTEHLSPTRSNGLTSMIKQIKLYALAFQTKLEQSKTN